MRDKEENIRTYQYFWNTSIVEKIQFPFFFSFSFLFLTYFPVLFFFSLSFFSWDKLLGEKNKIRKKTTVCPFFPGYPLYSEFLQLTANHPYEDEPNISPLLFVLLIKLLFIYFHFYCFQFLFLFHIFFVPNIINLDYTPTNISQYCFNKL